MQPSRVFMGREMCGVVMIVLWEQEAKRRAQRTQRSGTFCLGNKIAFAGAQSSVHMFNELSRQRCLHGPDNYNIAVANIQTDFMGGL